MEGFPVRLTAGYFTNATNLAPEIPRAVAPQPEGVSRKDPGALF
jgi:hypothetical protein